MVEFSIPAGVTFGDPGSTVFFSQRVDGKPYVNCMAYSQASQVEFSGLHVPTDFGMTIRVASGVPVKAGVGMSVADVRRGMAKLLPWVEFESGALPDDDLLRLVAGGQHVALMIDFSNVPAGSKLRRFVGSYQHGHAGWIAGVKQGSGRGLLVLWFDAFAPAGHQGRWLGWRRNFRGSVLRVGGAVRHFYLKEGQAVVDFPIPPDVLKHVAELEFQNGLLQHQLDLAVEAAQRASDANGLKGEALMKGADAARDLATALDAANV